jgi:hypothetical protein
MAQFWRAPGFDLPIQLGQAENRHFQFPSQFFQLARHFADLLIAVYAPISWRDTLKVIDHNKIQALALKVPRCPTNFAHGELGRIVNPPVIAAQRIGRRDQPVGIVIRDLPRSKNLAADARCAAQHASHELGGRHLKGCEVGPAAAHGRMLGYLARKRSLSEPRPGGKDYQLTRKQATDCRVIRHQAGHKPGGASTFPGLVRGSHYIDYSLGCQFGCSGVLANPRFSQRGLSHVDGFFRFTIFSVARLDEVLARFDQAAEGGLSGDDFGMVLSMSGNRRGVHQFCDVRLSAGSLQVAGISEPIRQQQQIGWVEGQEVAEHHLIGIGVEIIGAENGGNGRQFSRVE